MVTIYLIGMAILMWGFVMVVRVERYFIREDGLIRVVYTGDE
jgi:hypothetical protein